MLLSFLLRNTGQPRGAAWDKVKERLLLQDSSIVKFAKKIPGFHDLNLDDQIQLIKHSAMAGQIPYLANHDEAWKWFKEIILDMEGLQPLVLQCKSQIVSAVEAFRRFYATPGELALFSAVVILNQDVPQLTNRKAVEKLNNIAQRALKQEVLGKGNALYASCPSHTTLTYF
ncbi:steroid hormone receptor ERR2-like [Saccoglossus kowalevskii]